MVRGWMLAAMTVMLGGCVPDLGAWQVVESGVDAGPVVPGTDGGSPQQNPIDLGTPCPNPYLLVGTIAQSGEIASVMRVDPAGDTLCRASALVTEQRAFGYAIRDVDWSPELGELLGLDNAVLALDGEGFPRWRYQPFQDSYFHADWVAVLGSGASLRVAVAWAESSASLDQMRLLDANGDPTNTQIEPPFFGAMIAPHPDGTARLLMPSKGGPNIEVYAVNDATGPLGDSDASPLWPGTPPDLPDTYGYRVHLASDLATERLVITHEQGVALWQLGAPPPSTAIDCSSYCEGFQASAPDPNAADGVYSICQASGSSTRHLVHLSGGSCTLVIDGTSIGRLTLQDIALVRAAL